MRNKIKIENGQSRKLLSYALIGLAEVIAFAIISFAAAAQKSSDEQLQIEQELSAQGHGRLIHNQLNLNMGLSNNLIVLFNK